MSVSTHHLLSHGPVLKVLAKTAVSALRQRLISDDSRPLPMLPTPEVSATLSPRPAGLVRDYVRHVGGDLSAAKHHLPAHLFPQWGFPLQAQTLADLPYPLFKVINGGCRLEMNAPLPADEPLKVRAWLADVDDNGRRAVLHQVLATGTDALPNSVVAHLYAIVPLGGGEAPPAEQKKAKARVPADATELARWRLPLHAGLDFAKLTGDFNPVHWVTPYARAFGFRGRILHGFSTMARAIEGLNANLFSGSSHALSVFDCKFTRPLVLPATVGLYVHEGKAFVGDALGGPAYLVASYTTHPDYSVSREETSNE